jgi:hypothetical protein
MAINAVLPHLVISLVKHSYMPGTGTGMLFNLPLGVLLIHGQLSAHATSHAEVWRDAVLYALLLAASCGFDASRRYNQQRPLPTLAQPYHRRLCSSFCHLSP